MSPLRVVLDVETNGLLHELDRVHSLVLRNIDTEEVYSCTDQPGYLPITRGLALLSEATQIVGHNIISFDFRAIQKVYPSFQMRQDCDIYDTLVVSRVLWPELEPVDRQKFAHIASKYIGRHSLAAWGERLGVAKIKFQEESKKDPDVDNVWDVWSDSMQTYCEGDTLVSLKLYEYFQTQPLDPRCQELEHEFAKVMARQEQFGFPFDEKKAFALVNMLKVKRDEINDKLQEVFPPVRTERWSSKTGKRLKDHVEVFNPASRHQTSTRLTRKYPEIMFGVTEKGSPKVDDDVLETLGEKYPEAKLLAEYQLLNKRLGQIAEGKEAWLKHSQKYKDGRIHGSVKTNACVSGRCSHVSPNMAQVPSVGHPYGADCRSLFYAPDSWRLVGADASGLELRALGAWLAHFDGGEYAKLVSTEGFDIHTYNAKLFGIYDGIGDITKATRDLSKRLIYCVPIEGTTVLTKRGWKTYEELKVGELVMTYNQEKNIKEWKPILHIVEAFEDDVWEMSHNHSYKVQSTANHRWYVRKRSQALNVKCGWKTGARYMVPKVETTAEINQESNIIVNAPLVEGDCDGISVDWDWPKYGTDWTEKILQMSSKQRRAWLSGFMLADGFQRIKENQKPSWIISQLKNEHYEAALTAAYLEFGGHIHVSQGVQPNGKTKMQITIANKGHVTGQKLQKKLVGRKKVFCISTENESFVMRQGECITITGNCILYGGGSKKTGSIVSPGLSEAKQYEVGKATIDTFYRNLPAIKRLKDKIEERIDARGYLVGIDGRRLQIRSKHSALNQLLQSTGAISVKKATVILYDDLNNEGLKWGEDYAFVAHIHDEVQAMVRPKYTELYKKLAIDSFRKSGEYFQLLCPFTGEAREGQNWMETH
jgi:DNA polymerase I-like protein with 3'-5' exonuclease and polymerase domains